VAAAGCIVIGNTAVPDSLPSEPFAQLVNGYTLVSGGNLHATRSPGNRQRLWRGQFRQFTLTVQSGYQYTKSPAANPLNFAALQSQDDILATETAKLPTTGTCRP
jgi:hypothetical protein